MEKIVIIGGGASGLISAILSKNENNEVIILDTDEQYTPPNDVSEFEII